MISWPCELNISMVIRAFSVLVTMTQIIEHLIFDTSPLYSNASIAQQLRTIEEMPSMHNFNNFRRHQRLLVLICIGLLIHPGQADNNDGKYSVRISTVELVLT